MPDKTTEMKVNQTFDKAMDQINKLEKAFREGGMLEKAIAELDGDLSWLYDIRSELSNAYEALESGHQGCMGHISEMLSKKKKITPSTPVGMVAEGVLDGDDEDGFMARSQLYFLARDAIALHSMINDQDDLQPWVQSKIAQTSKDIDAVRRYTEYNEMEDGGADPMQVGPAEEPAMEGYSVMPDIDREKYQERDGLEGPFQTKSGKVVYYDTKEGSYYDPDTDMYISYDDWRSLDESTVLNELLPVVPVAIQAALAAGRYVAPWLLRKFAGKGGATILKRAATKGIPSAIQGGKTLVKKHGAVKTGLGTAGRVGTGGAVGAGAVNYGDEQDARVDTAADKMDALRARDAKKRAGYYNADGSIKEGRMSMRQLASMDKDKARKIEAMVGDESKYSDMGDYQEALYNAAKRMGLVEAKDEFKPHMMYDPKTGKGKMAKKEQDHLDMKAKGWEHEKAHMKEGKSPYKKGTKKYNDHMAAMHANSAEPKGKMIEDKVKTEATEFFTKIKKQAGVNK